MKSLIFTCIFLCTYSSLFSQDYANRLSVNYSPVGEMLNEAFVNSSVKYVLYFDEKWERTLDRTAKYYRYVFSIKGKEDLGYKIIDYYNYSDLPQTYLYVDKGYDVFCGDDASRCSISAGYAFFPETQTHRYYYFNNEVSYDVFVDNLGIRKEMEERKNWTPPPFIKTLESDGETLESFARSSRDKINSKKKENDLLDNVVDLAITIGGAYLVYKGVENAFEDDEKMEPKQDEKSIYRKTKDAYSNVNDAIDKVDTYGEYMEKAKDVYDNVSDIYYSDRLQWTYLKHLAKNPFDNYINKITDEMETMEMPSGDQYLYHQFECTKCFPEHTFRVVKEDINRYVIYSYEEMNNTIERYHSYSITSNKVIYLMQEHCKKCSY